MPATAPSIPSAGWSFSGRQDSLLGESPLFTPDDLAYFEAAKTRATKPAKATATKGRPAAKTTKAAKAAGDPAPRSRAKKATSPDPTTAVVDVEDDDLETTDELDGEPPFS